MIPQPVSIYYESFTTTAATFFHNLFY